MHKPTVYWIITSLALAVIALAALNHMPQTPVARAAGSTIHKVYLPLMLRNSGCGTGSLIGDGGFEQSVSGTVNPYWRITTNLTRTVFDNSGIPAPSPTHSGAWKAWLGGDNSLQQTLTQTLSVPPGAVNLQVSYWWLVNTSDSNPQGFDFVNVRLLNNSGVVLETLDHLYDIDQGTVWAQSTVTATQSYASQTIQLAFTTSTDSALPTSFFIDDISVTCH